MQVYRRNLSSDSRAVILARAAREGYVIKEQPDQSIAIIPFPPARARAIANVDGEYVQVSCVTGWLNGPVFSVTWVDWTRHCIPLLFFGLMTLLILLGPSRALDTVAHFAVIGLCLLWLISLAWLLVWCTVAMRLIHNLIALSQPVRELG